MSEVKRSLADNSLLIVAIVTFCIALILIIANIVVLLTNLKNRSKFSYLGDDNLAKECLEQSGDVSIVECLDMKAWSYYDEGNCEKALNVYEDAPVDAFDKYDLSDLYDRAYSLSYSCEDDTLEEYWRKKLREASSGLEARN